MSLLAADVSGKWSGPIELQGDIKVTADVYAEFSQKSDEITGKNGREDDASEPIRNGTLAGGKSMIFEVQYADADGAFKFDLTLGPQTP